LDLREDLISCLCLGVKSRALVLNAIAENLDSLKWWWLGVFIAPTTKPTVGVGLLSMVRQPRHPTVRVLTVSTVGALTSWCTGQSGAAPDRHCSLSGALWRQLLLLPRTVALSGHCAVDRCANNCCSAWCTTQSGGTPDSLVNYSGVRLEKPEGEELEVDPPWCTRHCPVCQTRVAFGFFCSFLLNPNSDLFIDLC
jgi:hypothetical protein